MKSKQILVKLEKDQYDKIKARADKYYLPLGAYVRMKTLDQFAFNEKKV